jgi:O-antigen ligase
LGFFLFLVFNATLFIRPAEIVPDLLGLEIALFVALACLAVSFPLMLAQLSGRALEAQPITVCVLGLQIAVVLSHLSHLFLTGAAVGGYEFAKMVVYYLLFVGLITTPDRLRQLLLLLLCCSTVVAGLAVLQYHGTLQLPTLKPAFEVFWDPVAMHDVMLPRLQGTGIFHDPNDLCIFLVVCILLSLYWLFDRRSGIWRGLWVGPLFLFGYALTLTHSRGGFLALLVGLLVFCGQRFGRTVTTLVVAAGAPLLLAMSIGRQMNFSLSEGTGQNRIQLWSDGLLMFREAPIFGMGMNKYGEIAGKVAHNSFVHAFAELGFFGGLLFLGAFALALWSLYRLGSRTRRIVDLEQRRLHPYLLAVVAAYAAGMMSLTLNYVMPTYTILGLAVAYRNMTLVEPSLLPLRCDAPLLGRLVLLSIGFLMAMTLFVRIFFIH